MSSKLSVVIVCHNSEDYILRNVNSIIDTAPEIVLIDDGSTDNTLFVLKNLADSYNHIRVLVNKYREGEAVSRNRAIISLNSEFIAIQRDCDTSRADRFQLQMEEMEKGFDLVGCHVVKTNPSGQTIGYVTYPPKEPQDLYACIVQNMTEPVLDQTILFNRQTVLKMGGFNSAYMLPTFDLVGRMLSKGIGVSNIQECLVSSMAKYMCKSELKDREENARIITAQFIRRNHQDPRLEASHFLQDCFTEYPYN